MILSEMNIKGTESRRQSGDVDARAVGARFVPPIQSVFDPPHTSKKFREKSGAQAGGVKEVAAQRYAAILVNTRGKPDLTGGGGGFSPARKTASRVRERPFAVDAQMLLSLLDLRQRRGHGRPIILQGNRWASAIQLCLRFPEPVIPGEYHGMTFPMVKKAHRE